MLVAVLTSAARWNVEQPLLTYSVPEELQDQLRLGQLVAVPYGERLVEGIVWELQADEYLQELGEDVVVRPLHAILDPVPALLPHQRILAEWMAEYYVTALAHCALVMLAPGLMQRSQLVLRLAEEYEAADEETTQGLSLRLRALLGLLQADGEVNVERLKKMLGQKQAKEVLQELQQSNLIVQTPQLSLPKARPRVQRIVRLLAQGEALQEWRARMEQQLQPCAKPEEPIRIVVPGGEATLAGFGISPSAETREVVGLVGPGSEATLAGFGVSPNAAIPQKVLGLRTSTNRRGIHSRGDRPHYNPWALSGATATLTLPEEDQASILARRQLAAVDLLECSINRNAPWTPNALCKASGLTAVQLHQLVHENIIAIETLEVRRDPLAGRTLVASQPLQLTADQQRALERILACCAVAGAHAPDPILLHGVTGSGKTEVYLQALAALIAQGKRGIMLVPEIALTTQAIQRVAGRFPGRVAIIHSELSMGERYDEWRRIRAGEVDIVIGSRSALFAPVPELGIIIVDEEHEPAYKQGEFKPTYHAREVAVKIGQILRIP
ncbi:MAG: DEAD/DEAH box helicase, partial [Chloroflexi bacterium]